MDAVGQFPAGHHLVPDVVLVGLLVLLMGSAIAVRLVIAAGVAVVRLGTRRAGVAGRGSRFA